MFFIIYSHSNILTILTYGTYFTVAIVMNKSIFSVKSYLMLVKRNGYRKLSFVVHGCIRKSSRLHRMPYFLQYFFQRLWTYYAILCMMELIFVRNSFQFPVFQFIRSMKNAACLMSRIIIRFLKNYLSISLCYLILLFFHHIRRIFTYDRVTVEN